MNRERERVCSRVSCSYFFWYGREEFVVICFVEVNNDVDILFHLLLHTVSL